MTPQAGDLLLEQIAPRLRAIIPKAVKPVGAEDSEELIHRRAAQMLDSVERHGKKVTPGNIAYYAVLMLKGGRRSQSSSRADVMAVGARPGSDRFRGGGRESKLLAGLDLETLAADLLAADREPIPDYAFDCHTLKGKRKGKTKADFFRDEHRALDPFQPGLFDVLAGS